MISVAAEFIPLVLACLVMLGSPGPAPLALAASGAAAGFWRGLAFYAGVMSGFLIAQILTLSGLFFLVSSFGFVGLILIGFSFCYIVWLAFKIATAPPLKGDGRYGSVPPGFLHGILVNIANPKLYAAFTTMFAAFVPDVVLPVDAKIVAGVVMLTIAMVTNLMWLAAGSAIAHMFQDPAMNRRIRVIFAGLMLLSVVFAFFGLMGQK